MNFDARIHGYEVIYHGGGRRVGIRVAVKLLGAGNQLVGTAHFHQADVDLPALDQAAMHDHANPHVSMHLHREDFRDVLDLLRNEDPLYLCFAGNAEGEGVASLCTAPEAVGEGEG